MPNQTSIEVIIQQERAPDLLKQARSGDADAFCELCRFHEGRLLRQAQVLCGSAIVAEELAQDVLVEAWKCLHRYDGRCQFFTWLCAILLNRHRNLRRERRPLPFSALSREEENSASETLDGLVDPGFRPDERTQESERNQALQRALCSLPPKHRDVIHLRFFVDDSLEGIACALNCSVGTVKSRLFHALEKLRRMPGLRHDLEPESMTRTRL